MTKGVMTEEMTAFMDEIIKQADLEHEQYAVHSGDKVLMRGEGRHLVVQTILDESLRKQLNDGKTWSLFTLVHLHSGTNWWYPLPVMSAGSVDIRDLMGAGGTRIISVTFVKKDAKKRVYKVEDKQGYVTKLTVYAR